MTATPAAERILDTSRPLHLGAVVGPFRRGGGDPTSRTDGLGRWWFAWRTPEGPASLDLYAAPAARRVTARAWGPGAQWLLDGLPDLLGEHDDPSGFVAHHPLVAEAARRFDGWRVPRSRLVLQCLIPSVIEQRVTGKEAFAAYRMLVRGHGEPAPGPLGDAGLLVAPDPRGWAMIPSWEWLKAGVDLARSSVAVRAAGRAGRLEECADLAPEAARLRLQALPGVGVWTSAEVGQRALGDADAVSFGDYHVAKNITWALTGEIGDDERLAEVLEPYAGHRFRVQRLLELAGAGRPRRGPRMTLPTHLPR